MKPKPAGPTCSTSRAKTGSSAVARCRAKDNDGARVTGSLGQGQRAHLARGRAAGEMGSPAQETDQLAMVERLAALRLEHATGRDVPQAARAD